MIFPPTECVELLDGTSMRATNNYGMSLRKWPEQDSLFFKFQGPSQASLKDTAKAVERIVAKHGGTGFAFARNEKEAEDLWMDRKNIYWSALSLIEGSRGMATDVWFVSIPHSDSESWIVMTDNLPLILIVFLSQSSLNSYTRQRKI